MNEHSQHADRLRTLLVSEEDVQRVFESSELAACLDCRAIVDEHLRLVSDLVTLSSDERDELAAVERMPAEAGRAEAALRAHILASGAPRARRWPSIAAAALLALAVGSHFFPRGAVEVPDASTMGERAVLLQPLEKVDSFVPFRWDVPLPAGGHFRLRIEGADFEFESDRLYEQEWSPIEPLEFPDEIHWTLEVYRASGPGEVFASYIGWAWR